MERAMITGRVLPSDLLRELWNALILIVPIGIVLFVEMGF
jgi:hypothetical protein